MNYLETDEGMCGLAAAGAVDSYFQSFELFKACTTKHCKKSKYAQDAHQKILSHFREHIVE